MKLDIFFNFILIQPFNLEDLFLIIIINLKKILTIYFSVHFP
jgi:hypothetical protein